MISLDPDNPEERTVFADLTDRVLASGIERGLLGMACYPGDSLPGPEHLAVVDTALGDAYAIPESNPFITGASYIAEPRFPVGEYFFSDRCSG